jgi:hypothetical protein
MKPGDIYNTPEEFAKAMAEHFDSAYVPDVNTGILRLNREGKRPSFDFFASLTQPNQRINMCSGSGGFSEYLYPVMILRLPRDKPIWVKPKVKADFDGGHAYIYTLTSGATLYVNKESLTETVVASRDEVIPIDAILHAHSRAQELINQLEKEKEMVWDKANA